MNESTQPSVLVEVRNRVGWLVLNRPAALNALDLPMIRALTSALVNWQDDPSIHAVVIEGAGNRAFCAGGDIRAIRQSSLKGDADAIEMFFAEEYALNLLIARYRKPYVALINGFCMGGGIGVSIHGTIRVATEQAVFAMPETAIALFPDVGASFFLPRLPGELGAYYGLTGARATGADAVHAGFATHFVLACRLPDLREALARDGIGSLAAFTTTLPPFGLGPHRCAIEDCFTAPGLHELLSRLDRAGVFGQNTRALLDSASPSALLWTVELLRAGAGRTLEEALQAELRLTRHVTRHPDFLEGVRAMVIDKDRLPRWSPGRLDDVNVPAIMGMLDR